MRKTIIAIVVLAFVAGLYLLRVHHQAVSLVNDTNWTLFGKDSEWFWALMQFVVVTITLALIYGELRISSAAHILGSLTSVNERWTSPGVVAQREGICAAFLRGEPVLTLGNQVVFTFFEELGLYVERGWVPREVVWDTYSFYVENYWDMCSQEILHRRKESNDSSIFEHFDRLATAMRCINRKRKIPFTPRTKEQLTAFARGERVCDPKETVTSENVSNGESVTAVSGIPSSSAPSAVQPQPRTGMTPQELFPIEYKKHDDDIRHYSTTRSALTSFLMTAGLTLLAYYLSSSYPKERWFLPVAGILLLLTALFVCLIFSYRTERSSLHLRCLWKWANGDLAVYPNFANPASETESEIKRKWTNQMRSDEMNIAALIVVPTIIVVFLVSTFNLKQATVSSTDSLTQLLTKSVENASKGTLRALELAQSASQSAEDSRKSAAESAKSADAAAKLARDSIGGSSNNSRLVSSPPSISGISIADIQRDLLLVGFDAGPVDGKPGRRSKNAARAFCLQIGIEFKNYQDQTFLDALTSRVKKANPAAR